MGIVRGKLASTALLLALSVLCLQSIDALNTSTKALTESEQTARNRAASSLYAKLATLPRPATQSDLTRAVHTFINTDSYADGATLFDPKGRLVAQLGRGNDQLLARPPGQSITHIPIKSGDSHVGHVLLNFRPARSNVESVVHHAAMASALVMLGMLTIGLLSLGARTVFSMLRAPVDSD